MRQKIIFLSSLMFAVVLLVSCSNKDNEEIRSQANKFINAMHKPVDFKKMKKIYRNMSFYSVWRVDEHQIISIIEQDENVIVSVSTFFINSKDEKSTNDFLLQFQNIEGVWLIVNSKGITSVNKADYVYAIENGFVKADNGLWDIELTAAVRNALNSRDKR